MYINVLSKCKLQRRLISMMSSDLHEGVIGEAINQVAWTVTRLC